MEADLIGANLQEVEIGSANFKRADLEETNLQDAYLWEEEHERAILADPILIDP
ncbi:MAG: pentapeptide repeat-containing protein [Acidobacteriota bacterium]|nr:pentapeptide repeat-containing protein [Acidobacteriota bacterium]